MPAKTYRLDELSATADKDAHGYCYRVTCPKCSRGLVVRHRVATDCGCKAVLIQCGAVVFVGSSRSACARLINTNLRLNDFEAPGISDDYADLVAFEREELAATDKEGSRPYWQRVLCVLFLADTWDESLHI